MRPGTTITRSETRPARGPRTNTGAWFVVGATATVDSDPAGARKPVKSLVELATRFGTRTGFEVLHDSVESYFKEGGSEVYVSKSADATDAAHVAALAAFTADLGPGQVSAPGKTTPAIRAGLLAHARSTNRIAILDATNTGTAATLVAEVDATGAPATDLRYGGLFGPWLVIEGLTGPGSASRTIPPSGVVAGLIARRTAEGVSPNQPPAGDLGESRTALDTTFSFSDVDRQTLTLNSVNAMRDMYDGVRIYGFRTLADATTDPNWVNLANARLFQEITAKADAAAERFVFRELDGQRRTVSEYGGVLTGLLLPYWQRGSLYGAVPEEAFRVDVGPAVNSDQSMADGQLKANIILKMSPFAEEVILELVKARVTEAI